MASQSAETQGKLDTTYHDTATYDLARAGITLRHRTCGHERSWRLNAEFAELLTARLRGRSLRPVATVATHRRLWTLADKAGRPLAEVTLDSVTAEALGPRSALTRWNEVGVELAGDLDETQGAHLLEAADRRLHESGLSAAQNRMKERMALTGAVDGPASGHAPGKSPTAGGVVLAYLRDRVQEIFHHDLLARRSESDATRRLRAAVRRTRAALKAFRPLFRGARTESLIDELRWLSRELKPAQDEQVLALPACRANRADPRQARGRAGPGVYR